MPHGWLYADPGSPGLAASLRALATPAKRRADAGAAIGRPRPTQRPTRVLDTLRGSKITVVGKHPDGFDTCEYDEKLLFDLAGMKVETVQLGQLFDKARAMDADRVGAARAGAARELEGLDAVDQEQLDRSFRVFCALEDVQQESGAKGLAVRCWPEMFTEYGCAACGPMAMMNQKQVPSACEADVHGSLSQLMLQELAGEPAWMADLVDITPADDTAVLWHCGLAPISMRDPQAHAEATIHTNRRMPLLHQFPIKPGRVTLARLSRARNETKLMIAGAEVDPRADGIHRLLRAPCASTGRRPRSGARSWRRGSSTTSRSPMATTRRHSGRLPPAGNCPCWSSPEMGAFDVEAPNWGRIPAVKVTGAARSPATTAA